MKRGNSVVGAREPTFDPVWALSLSISMVILCFTIISQGYSAIPVHTWISSACKAPEPHVTAIVVSRART
ncbi:hypothetical protein L1887_31712 [Cichorium endivia]|nr:hypothetical protein L1887_31712 [Cichorium endivia]